MRVQVSNWVNIIITTLSATLFYEMWLNQSKADIKTEFIPDFYLWMMILSGTDPRSVRSDQLAPYALALMNWKFRIMRGHNIDISDVLYRGHNEEALVLLSLCDPEGYLKSDYGKKSFQEILGNDQFDLLKVMEDAQSEFYSYNSVY